MDGGVMEGNGNVVKDGVIEGMGNRSGLQNQMK